MKKCQNPINAVFLRHPLWDTGTTNRQDLRLNQTDIQFSNGNMSFNSQIGDVSILRRASKNQFIFDLRSDDQDPKKTDKMLKERILIFI